MNVKCTMEDVYEGCNGGCIACGDLQMGDVEPDARNRTCESCGEPKVYGLEELIVMGKLDLEDEDCD